MFIIIWFIFGILGVNFVNGAMIHASEYSETPANVLLSNKSFIYFNKNQNEYMPGKPEKDLYGLPILIWSSYRLCRTHGQRAREVRKTDVGYRMPTQKELDADICLGKIFFLSTKNSSCTFLISQKPYVIQSQISGNIQWQKYEFEPTDFEMLTNITIWSDGIVDVLNRTTELRCNPNFFDNEPTYISIRATENARCRFAVILQGEERNLTFEDPERNMLHNYYINKNVLLATFSVLCAFVLALDLAHTIYFCS